MDMLLVFIFGAGSSFIPLWFLLSRASKKSQRRKKHQAAKAWAQDVPTRPIPRDSFTSLLEQECLERALASLYEAYANLQKPEKRQGRTPIASYTELSEIYDLVSFLNPSDTSDVFRDAVMALTSRTSVPTSEKRIKVEIALNALKTELMQLQHSGAQEHGAKQKKSWKKSFGASFASSLRSQQA